MTTKHFLFSIESNKIEIIVSCHRGGTTFVYATLHRRYLFRMTCVSPKRIALNNNSIDEVAQNWCTKFSKRKVDNNISKEEKNQSEFICEGTELEWEMKGN